MMYYMASYYTMSNLGALEKKALPWLDVLQDKIVTDEQLPDIERSLHELCERLETENPRCKGVEVRIEKTPYMQRVYVRFGAISYVGTPCEPLDAEGLKILKNSKKF